MYNQLLRDKEAMDEDNSRLRQKRDEQKENVLRIERALTYVKRQVAELQTKQRRELTPQPLPNDQTISPPTTPLQATLLPATPLESTLIGENKKIVIVPDPPIFNEDGKKISYNHWIL